MMVAEKELVISRINAGCLKCTLDNQILLLKYPSRLQRYMAEEVYMDTLRQAELAGSYTEAEYMSFLKSKNIWNINKQKQLDDMGKNLEELKVGLYQSTYKSQQRQTIRNALALTKQEQAKLAATLHEFDYLTAVGVATMAKARYVIAASLHKLDGSRLFDDDALQFVPDSLIEAVAEITSAAKLKEEQFREIARTDPWRTIWLARKNESNVFGLSAIDLNDEQRLLSIWSNVYDNVYEHPECPEDAVVTDDDMLDGWMIFQKRKRESERGASAVDNLVDNEKIKNSEEIYIPVDTVEDARKIAGLNDPAGALLKRKREALLKERGVVNEKDMPDSQMKIMQEVNRQYIEGVRGNNHG